MIDKSENERDKSGRTSTADLSHERSDVPNGISSRLRECANKVGGQKELARAAGISLGTLRHYLSGRSQPNVSHASKLAIAAGVSLSWLATGKEEPGQQKVTRSSASDARLMGRLTEGILKIFKEVGQATAIRHAAERATEYHDRIVADTPDPDDRLVRVGEVLEQLRQELRAAADQPAETKHSA